MQPAGDPPEVRLLPVGVPHHQRLAALREATAYPASDLLQPRGLWVAIQVVVAVIGERPGARLVVVPEDPRRWWSEGGEGGHGGREADERGQRFGEQPRGVCSRIKPGATGDKHFRRGGHRTQRVWPGEGCGAREAGSPQVALDVDAGLDSGLRVAVP